MEQVAVFPKNYIQTITFDGIGKVKVDAKAGLTDTFTFIASLFRSTLSNVTGNQVTKGGVFPFQVVIAL